jgi:hypothetical protein
MAWKPEVFVEGKWSRNGLVFATREEAEQSAKDLMRRWSVVDDCQAVFVSGARVNYSYANGKLEPVPNEDQEYAEVERRISDAISAETREAKRRRMMAPYVGGEDQ